MELTVLGCSGSLRRARRRRVQRLSRARRRRRHLDGLRQRHRSRTCSSTSIPADLTAVVITHGHADHCVDIYGLHVMYRYGLERSGLPVYAPEGRRDDARRSSSATFGDTFDWRTVGDGDQRDDRRRRAALLAHRSPAADGGGRDRARRQAARLHRRHRTGVERRGVRRRRRSRAVRGDVPARRHPRADPPLGAPGRRAARATRRPAG